MRIVIEPRLEWPPEKEKAWVISVFLPGPGSWTGFDLCRLTFGMMGAIESPSNFLQPPLSASN